MSRQLSRIEQQAGYTLVELLVVIIVIGALAAIAIPVFLNQRTKAHDASTKADVVNLGREVATYFVDGTSTLALDFSSKPGWVVVSDGSYTADVNLTNGTSRPSGNASANLDDPDAWCVSLTDTAGSDKDYRYTASSGLTRGTC